MNELTKKSKSTKWKITTLILLIMTMLLGAFAYMTYMANTELTDKVSRAESDRDALKNELSAIDKSASDKPKPASNADTTNYTSEKGVNLTITSPSISEKVNSPLKIEGTAPGNWFSEGQLTASIKDSEGTIIASGALKIPAEADQTKPVKFIGELKWVGQVSGNGILILEKSNPSGLAANADRVNVPVKF